MDCDHVRPLMTAHLGGSETPEEWEGLRHHLRCCPPCRAEAEGLIGTWNALAELPDADAPAGVWERIQSALPAPITRPVRRTPWIAHAATAAIAALVSVAASLLLPYERAVRLCSDGLNRLIPPAALPDPALFFVVGLVYGLVPLGLVALAAARRLTGAGGHPGLGAGLLFAALAFPYVLIACSGLPGTLATALLAGIAAGALAGGPAGVWVGNKFLAPAGA